MNGGFLDGEMGECNVHFDRRSFVERLIGYLHGGAEAVPSRISGSGV